ncbi:hypothetical protein BDZ91DRAFT_734116 [Kalaharituber pfeilii]|nr:hypothetical protein BDZ91DRAFT_734116 [Kalaharituber pfeilii]
MPAQRSSSNSKSLKNSEDVPELLHSFRGESPDRTGARGRSLLKGDTGEHPHRKVRQEPQGAALTRDTPARTEELNGSRKRQRIGAIDKRQQEDRRQHGLAKLSTATEPITTAKQEQRSHNPNATRLPVESPYSKGHEEQSQRESQRAMPESTKRAPSASERVHNMPSRSTETPPKTPARDPANDLGSWLRTIESKRRAIAAMRSRSNNTVTPTESPTVDAKVLFGAAQCEPETRPQVKAPAVIDLTEDDSKKSTIVLKKEGSDTSAQKTLDTLFQGRNDSSEPSTPSTSPELPDLPSPAKRKSRLSVSDLLVAPVKNSASPPTPAAPASSHSIPGRETATPAPPDVVVTDSTRINGGREYWADGTPRFHEGPTRKNPVVTNSQARHIWRPPWGPRPELEWRKSVNWVMKDGPQEAQEV